MILNEKRSHDMEVVTEPPHPPEKNLYDVITPSFLPYVGRLESGPRLVGRIGSEVRVSAGFCLAAA